MTTPGSASPAAREARRDPLIETDDLGPVPLHQRQHWSVPALIFGGLEFTIPVLMVGAVLVKDYSLGVILWILLVALAIQWVGNAVQGYLGARTGLSSSFLARQSFGEVQGRLVVGSTLALLSMGWWAVQTAVAGNAIAAMLGIDYHSERLAWALITIFAGALFAVPAVLGYSSMKWTDYFAVPAGLVLIALAIYYAFERSGVEGFMSWNPAGSKGFLAGVSVVLGANVAQWVIAADYTRYSHPTLRDQIKIPLGIVAVGLPLFYVGALMAVGIGDADIVRVMSELGVPFWGFLILWFATWTSQIVNNYSMGLALANVCGRTSNRARVLLTIAGTLAALLLALAGVADYFIDFLLATALVYPAFAGVMFADFLVLRKIGRGRARAWNWNATLALGAGITVGYVTQYQYAVGIPAVHSLVAAGVVYLGCESLIERGIR